MTGGFSQQVRPTKMEKFPSIRSQHFSVRKCCRCEWNNKQLPELTELKRKHPPSSLARVWVGAGGSAFFGKNASLRSPTGCGSSVGRCFCRWCFVLWRNYFSAVFCVWGCCNNLEGDLGGSPGGSTVSHWKKWCQGVNSHQWAVADLSLWGPCLDWTQIKKSWLYFFCLLYIYIIYIIKFYNIHLLNLYHWIFCGFVFFNSCLVNTFIDRRPW